MDRTIEIALPGAIDGDPVEVCAAALRQLDERVLPAITDVMEDTYRQLRNAGLDEIEEASGDHVIKWEASPVGRLAGELTARTLELRRIVTVLRGRYPS